MKTNELITLLANGSAAVDPAGGRRLALALGWGMAGTILLMALLLGVRADLAQAARLPMFWAKILVPLTAAAAALQLARRLSIPGMRVATAPFVLGALLLLALSGATVALAAAAPDGRVALIFGSTWKTCALCITMLSLPLLVAALWAIKGLAPTRPVLAGGRRVCSREPARQLSMPCIVQRWRHRFSGLGTCWVWQSRVPLALLSAKGCCTGSAANTGSGFKG